MEDKINFTRAKAAMSGYLAAYKAEAGYQDPDILFAQLPKLIEQILKREGIVKFNVVIRVRFHKGEETTITYFTTKPQTYFPTDPFTIDLSPLTEMIARFTSKGSNWIVDEVEAVYVNTGKYEPLKGSSYVKLPPKLSGKHAIINVKNKDNTCCRIAIRSALFPAAKNSERLSCYPEEDGLDFSNIDFPTPINQIHKVERQNNLSINVYGWEKDNVVIYRLSKTKDRLINLMLYDGHYCWIKNLDRLLNNKKDRSSYHCGRCLLAFYDKAKLATHQQDCCETVRVEMPKDGYISFKNYWNQLKVPYIIYADFEALNLKVHTCEGSPEVSSTTKTFKHEPCGFCYIVVRSDGYTEPPVLYRGLDPIKSR